MTATASKTYARDDFQAKALAERLGFTTKFHEADERRGFTNIDDRATCPHNSLQFVKGNETVWYTPAHHRDEHWTRATLGGDNVYTGHRRFKSVEDALRGVNGTIVPSSR